MLKLGSLFIILCCLSCSSVSVSSSGKFPITFTKNKTDTKDISVSVTKEFFLWGLIPGTHQVVLDEELGNRGFDLVSDIRITQKNSRSDVIWTLLTFGVYYPQTFIIEGKSTVK